MWEKYKYSALPHTLEGQTPATKPDASHSWLTWCCHVWITCLSAIILLLTLPISIWCFLKIVPDYERVVVFRLGRIRPPKGPGLILLLPLIDQLQRVDMRIRAFRIQPCKVKSRDDVLVSVEAGVQFRVCDPVLSVLSVQDLNFVIQNTAENLLVQNFGRKYLREIYGDKMRLGEHFKEDINEQVKPLGVCVEHVDLLVEAVMQPHEEHVPLTSQAVNPNGGLEQLIMQFVSIATQVSAQDTKPSTDLSLEEMLSRLERILSESLVSEIRSSYQFFVIQKDGKRSACFLDLTSGSGLCGMGILTFSPDVTLEITEADLLSVVRGDLNPMIAYTTGRLHVTGNLQTALLLQKVLPKILHS
ncbi:stomatin-like protein 1 isoform X2 [Hyla sarda]|uniref:stomatin-like protein 1 isoform X2 n=1 Tax=Hyla sarda TaxID=327740 RepID=UPI0024C4244D|nr:stomatin-like protein 1 isoform X2 [Hyla sarda]